LTGFREAGATPRLRLAIDIADPALGEQVVAALSLVDGVELVAVDDAPEAVVVAPRSMARAREEEPDLALTGREAEVLALLAEGASNKQIARRLGISAHTAKYHVASLMEKLDAVSRTDAVAHAARLGVLHL
jgi:DNA-binding CsgD family transcriptional regulator